MPENLCCCSHEAAIVGIGCRFPGAVDSPDAFWNLIAEGCNAIGELPVARRRWQSAEFKGGFLEGVDLFDAQFFGISASEARYMDPQQRLLLEVAWEAIENANIDPDSLNGRRVGVFVGTFTNDYELLQSRAESAGVGPYFGTGTSSALLAGRLAYRFGLIGPALVVNTACSSSLVALHLARRSISAGEVDLALVAGVNLILSDEISASFRAAGMLSPDAQCKPWDASANGYVRSEGCAAVLLEKLDEARARGARIWTRVIGSAVNQDGASGGITAPSAAAQQRLIVAALQDAGIAADDVQYIEAHGTGTPVGDPIEYEALAQVFSTELRQRHPLLFGSIKGNLGHTEAAAGLAGVIKTALAMRHGRIPATINHRQLNPELRLERIPAHIPVTAVDWPGADDGTLIAGVNSFGFSGTNAHVILALHQEDRQAVPSSGDPPHMLCLSAPNVPVLEQVAERYEAYLRSADPITLPAVCQTAYAGRKHFRHRLAVTGDTLDGIAAGLAAFRTKNTHSHCHSGVACREHPRIAFLFSGQGVQHWGMGRELFETDETFRETLLECDGHLTPKLGRSLIELLYGEQDTGAVLAETRYTQPALFALQVSLLKMFAAWGVEPAAVLGHSIGEFAAAVAAKTLTMTDALTLIEARGRLMQALPEGGMTAVQADAVRVDTLLAALPKALSLAAINAPDACVIAGDKDVLAAAHERLSAEDIGHMALDVSHAFHSPMMQGMVEPFRALLEQVQRAPAAIPFFSTVTGRLVGEELTRAEYWCEQLVRPVLFLPAIRRLAAARFDACLELGPSPVLVNLAKRGVSDDRIVWLAAQQKGKGARRSAVDAAARLYTLGVRLDHRRITHASQRSMVFLPAYPFQRKSFWIEPLNGGESKTHSQGTHMMKQDADVAVAHLSAPANADAVLKDYYQDLSARVRASSEQGDIRPFIRFAPFSAIVPGFTWLPTFLGRPHADDVQLKVDRAHSEMRAVLFGGIESRHVRRVLDIGCGYATDLIELARLHGHWEMDGCNISEAQIDFGRRAIAQAGLDNRIHLHHVDSSKDDFPGLYDLIISQQVIHHIQDKDAVLRNISDHLRKGAFLVAAEIISNLDERIDHDPSSAHFETKRNWARMLADNQLRLLRCVDVSREIANYLHDDDFDRTLRQQVGDDIDDSTRAHLYGPHSLGQLLQRGLASYMLLLVQRDYLSTGFSLMAENLSHFEQPVAYGQARRGIVTQPGRKPAPVQPPANIVDERPPLEPVKKAVPELPVSPPVAGRNVRERLCEMVGELLECEPDSLDTEQTLVAQGMNSILAMDLTRRLKTMFGLVVPVKSLLNDATISALVQSVSRDGAAETSAPEAQRQTSPSFSSKAMQAKGDGDLGRDIGSLDEAEIDRLLAKLEPFEGPRF